MNAEEINIQELYSGCEPDGQVKTAWVTADQELPPRRPEPGFLPLGIGLLAVAVCAVILWAQGAFR